MAGATFLVACGSSGPTSTADDTTRLTTTIINGPFTLVDAAVSEQDGSPPSLVYNVRISNASSSSFQIQYGGCWAFLRLYARADRSGTPLYDSGPPGIACTLDSHTTAVPPGTTVPISSQIVLDPGLSPGHYFASVAISPNGAATILPAGEVDILR